MIGRLRGTALWSAVVIVAALAVASCGGSGDGDEAASATPSGSSETAPSTPVPKGSDEQQVRALVASMTRAMAKRDFRAACSYMAEEAQKQVETLEKYPSCAAGLSDYVTDDDTGASKLKEDLDAHVVSVKVDGDTAAVGARQKGEPTLQTATLVRDDGQWKLTSWFTSGR